jgi:hypothetical protein
MNATAVLVAVDYMNEFRSAIKSYRKELSGSTSDMSNECQEIPVSTSTASRERKYQIDVLGPLRNLLLGGFSPPKTLRVTPWILETEMIQVYIRSDLDELSKASAAPVSEDPTLQACLFYDEGRSAPGVPLVCVSYEENISYLMASSLYQRRIWDLSSSAFRCQARIL